jgi:Cu/Ag efflux pump CusA
MPYKIWHASDVHHLYAVEGAVLRFRPVMMTMLVASLGLPPAALPRELVPIRSVHSPS